MKPFDLSLYLVTDRTLNKNLNLIQIVEEAVKGGVTIVQLREKEADLREIKELGIELLKILRPKNIPLLINDHPIIAKEIHAGGVHLGSKDVSPQTARECLGPDAIIGLSIDSIEQFQKTDISQVDYLAASPVFPTVTKPDLGTPFLLEGLKKLCAWSPLPVVAIGGISAENLSSVLETNVAGIAVVSAICASHNPRATAQNLKALVRSSKNKVFRVLTIAGSDSGGGAGIQADLKTFQALGCYGMSAITALTAQNTVGVKSIYPVSSKFVSDELSAVLDDIGVDGVKIGMLFSSEIVEVVSDVLRTYHIKQIVLDPVMVAKSGDSLLKQDAITEMKELLFPLATVVTPNLPEAMKLTSHEILNENDMMDAAHCLRKSCRNILIKGGHGNDPERVSDLLVTEDGEHYWFRNPRIRTKNTHGTGCTYSAAITAYLSQGKSVLEAVESARHYLQRAISQGATRQIGQGFGPLEHQCAQ